MSVLYLGRPRGSIRTPTAAAPWPGPGDFRSTASCAPMPGTPDVLAAQAGSSPGSPPAWPSPRPWPSITALCSPFGPRADCRHRAAGAASAAGVRCSARSCACPVRSLRGVLVGIGLPDRGAPCRTRPGLGPDRGARPPMSMNPPSRWTTWGLSVLMVAVLVLGLGTISAPGQFAALAMILVAGIARRGLRMAAGAGRISAVRPAHSARSALLGPCHPGHDRLRLADGCHVHGPAVHAGRPGLLHAQCGPSLPSARRPGHDGHRCPARW
jgi:hypothetical protein